jgi:hypothetical protein
MYVHHTDHPAVNIGKEKKQGQKAFFLTFPRMVFFEKSASRKGEQIYF